MSLIEIRATEEREPPAVVSGEAGQYSSSEHSQPVLLTDNLWSTYSDKGAFVEKKGVSSVPVFEESRPGALPYVLTDIMTYFTMLVGIYFPSVTGEAPHLPASPASVSVSVSLCIPPMNIFL